MIRGGVNLSIESGGVSTRASSCCCTIGEGLAADTGAGSGSLLAGDGAGGDAVWPSLANWIGSNSEREPS